MAVAVLLAGFFVARSYIPVAECWLLTGVLPLLYLGLITALPCFHAQSLLGADLRSAVVCSGVNRSDGYIVDDYW